MTQVATGMEASRFEASRGVQSWKRNHRKVLENLKMVGAMYHDTCNCKTAHNIELCVQLAACSGISQPPPIPNACMIFPSCSKSNSSESEARQLIIICVLITPVIDVHEWSFLLMTKH